MTDPNRQATIAGDPSVPTEAPTMPTTPKGRTRHTAARALVLGSLLVGGVAGAAILAPPATNAATSTTGSASTPAASSGTDVDPHAGGPGMGGPGFGGHPEAVSDTSVAAAAIGITEAQLQTALSGGQTVAQVATAHGVAVQKVIDALVADGLKELAAQVTAGQLTQAQADAMKAAVTQRATDQVNGTLMGGSH
jgi:hypothetical protein